MAAKTWQLVTLVTIAIVGVLLIADGFVVSRNGTLGFSYARVAHPGRLPTYRVTGVDANGPANAVLQRGDKLQLADTSVASRARFRFLTPGATIDFRVTRGERHFIASVPIRQQYDAASLILGITYLVLGAALTAVAGLIALRRPDEPAARALVTFFVMYALSIACSLALPSAPALTFPLGVVSSLFLTLGILEATRFTTLFPSRAASGIRAAFRRAYPYLYAAAVVLVGAAHVEGVLLERDPDAAVVALIGVWWAIVGASLAASLAAATREASGPDLQRIRWTSLSIAVGVSGMLVLMIAQLLGNTDPWTAVLPLTLLAIPAGVTYAMLRHRLLDIRFAINRALVFGGVSAIVVAAFGTLEWLIGRFLIAWGHVTSASLELVLALALGFSLRAIHGRTERVVDDVFFRERHRHEAALRRFAHEAAFVTDRRTLLERTIAEVVRHAQTASAAVYIARGEGGLSAAAATAGFPPAVDLDDPLAVRLRAFHEPAHAHDIESAVTADLALPMIVRGEFTGTLICGAKTTDEPYAPDEVAVLADLARALAAALDVLDVAALRAEVARLSALAYATSGAPARFFE